MGTGFWFLGEATHAPVDVKDNEAGRIDNQIDVMCKTFLGLTVACARCHDHKFDAISAYDYYSLSGFLQSSRRQDVLLDPNQRIQKQAELIGELARKGDRLIPQTIDTTKTYLLDDSPQLIAATIEALAANPNWLNTKQIKIEGETLTTVEKDAGVVTIQELKPQADTRWSGHKQLWWHEGKEGDSFTVEFELPFAARFEVLGNFTIANDYGVAEISLDDQVIAQELDLYSATLGLTGNKSLGTLELGAGKHQLKIRSVGIHPEAAKKFMFGLDYLLFKPTETDSANREEAALLQELAVSHEVSVDSIKRWIQAVTDPAVAQISHPAYPIREVARRLGQQPQANFSVVAREMFEQLEEAQNKYIEFADNAVMFSGFDELSLAHWFTTGTAFTSGNLDDVRFESADRKRLFVGPHEAHSGLLGRRMQGVIRSPTFEIKHPFIHYRLRAKDVQIRLIVDGFVMDIHNPLLFKGFNFKHSSDDYQWRTQGTDLKNYIGHRAHIEIIDHGSGFVALDEIWFSDESSPPEGRSNLAATMQQNDYQDIEQFATTFAKTCSQIPDPEFVQLLNWFSSHRQASKLNGEFSQFRELKNKIGQLQKETPLPMMAVGMTEGTPEDEFVFIRGNSKNLGEPAKRDIITALQQPSRQNLFDPAIGSGRMYLADAIANQSNPLTTRVVVNRLWHHLTGRGIVGSVDNFGVLGEEPTHPELLDYLATEFAADGWSTKRMLKRLMLTSTYQMSSQSDPTFVELDPENELLHHFRIRRMQGEVIRDSILAISGRLDQTMYGPSVAIHLTPFMQGRGRPGRSGPADGAGRRSIYLEVRRNFLSPMMLAFDTPIPFNSIGRRTVSNVPAQALIMMNDPFVVEQAKLWAERLIAEHPEDTSQRILAAYQSAFGRDCTAEELKTVKEFLNTQAAESLEIPEDQIATSVELWADFCHMLFNVKEFIYIR